MNTTELIIKSLTDSGNSIEFLPADKGKIYVSINGDPAQLVFCDFIQFAELFIPHYLNLGIESTKRIDGGCIAGESNCPGCQQEITPENAGGYRTFCMDCVKIFPDFPTDGRRYTIEISSMQADSGLKETIFKWVSDECSNLWHSPNNTKPSRLQVGCPNCGESWKNPAY